ncbi:TIMELESS-interacting protein-like [Mizuhopecten yessoensis]|uniref:TIMELESS-interacting protein-like n=1 Tax=Mizuhopecten yessoensis TaxID=6573 RepID=UPI000B45C507|nr:TIMELESS-interacting protein-like [Mizuhopecten yessoensis]XP_021362320.1 TIMELESS-interacting protein-like [Mizuhopecten yessoensis]
METIDLNMEDIFEDHDDDLPSVGPLPDLPEEDGSGAHHDNEDGEDAENSEILSKLKDLSKGAAKKVVRKPMPKLDATRLCGERGIPILPKTFEGIQFKGKGHEAKDLGVIMRYLEHWAHRLFPKMPFDEVLERIERLGTNKEVQSCIKKMRLDMPILSSDFVTEADDEDEDGQTNGTNQNGGTQPDRGAEEVWDEMIRDEEEAMKQRPTPVKTSHLLTALSQTDTPSSYSTDSSHTPSTPSTSSTSSTPSTPHTTANNGSSSLAMGLTPEQAERIERNKRLAMEKRNKGKAVFKVPATPTSVNGSPITKTTPSGKTSNFDQQRGNGTPVILTDSDVLSNIISQQDEGKSHQSSDVTPLMNGSVKGSDVTPLTNGSVIGSDVTPLTNGSVIGSESEMSEVFPVIDNSKVKKGQSSSTYDSSQEMSEVIPLISNIRGDNYSGDCSPSKIRKTDSI